MTSYLKAFVGWLAIAMLLVTSCRNGSSDIENAQIPRLMIEKRGVNYGSMSGKTVQLPVSRTQIFIEKEPLINEFDVQGVELVEVELGKALLLQMTEKGARDLYRTSVSNNGSRIVLTINGNAVGSRRLDGAIQDGNFYTFVELPERELGQLVLDMKNTLNELQIRKATH